MIDRDFDLTDPGQASCCVAGAKSEKELQKICNRIINAHGGVQPEWFPNAVYGSGLATAKRMSFGKK